MITIKFYINDKKEIDKINLISIQNNYVFPLNKWAIRGIKEDLLKEVNLNEFEPNTHYKVKMKPNYEINSLGIFCFTRWSIVEMRTIKE